MGELIAGDDGLPVEEVGSWAKEKHELLCKYVDISRGVRAKWLGPGKAGATYIDLFCGPGRAQVRKTGEFIDGSCVAAWKKSVAGNAPFSKVYIGDADPERLRYAAERLRRLDAPVVEVLGKASESVAAIAPKLNAYSLHFAFLDPYNLGAFDFSVIEALAKFKFIDMLVHVSKMDLQRNLGLNVAAERSAFDQFAPGWRSAVNLNQGQSAVRREVFDYWRRLVSETGVPPSTDMKLITGSKNQPLYWLLLAAKHDLAHKFWRTASASDQFSFL